MLPEIQSRLLRIVTHLLDSPRTTFLGLAAFFTALAQPTWTERVSGMAAGLGLMFAKDLATGSSQSQAVADATVAVVAEAHPQLMRDAVAVEEAKQ